MNVHVIVRRRAQGVGFLLDLIEEILPHFPFWIGQDKQTSCLAAGMAYVTVDYVTRRFNASLAFLKKPQGLDLR